MFILLYGSDGSGKSVQCKSIAEMNDFSEHWSFSTKNRKLYENSSVPSIELVKLYEDNNVNPYQTIDAFHNQVSKTIKENIVKLIVIDEITQLRSWAQPVVIEGLNKVHRAKNESTVTVIGEKNYKAWEEVNKLTLGKFEQLSNWATINDCTVIAITSVREIYRNEVDTDNKTRKVTTGMYECHATEPLRKLAEVRVKLEKDGKNGKGYYAIFEKMQDWMLEGKDFVKVDKTGLMIEFMARGIIE